MEKDKGTENPLTENFENKAEVVLSELNDKIRYILQHIIGDTTARATAEIPIYFGLIKLGKAISTLFQRQTLVFSSWTYIAMSEQLDWAGYYKGLCYENSDKFEVWKLKAANYFEVDPIIQNPIC